MSESNRRKRRAKPNVQTRQELEAQHGQVWDENQLVAEFTITAIIGDRVVVRRKADDNPVGTMRYQNEPRLYFGFEPQKIEE
jgi:hypothetical protein